MTSGIWMFSILQNLENKCIFTIPLTLIATALSSGKAAAYVYSKMKQSFAYYNLKHITGKPHNPTGQKAIERANPTLKEMLVKHKREE